MNSITLVNELYKYHTLFTEIEAQEKEYESRLEETIPLNFFKSVSLRYDTTSMKLNYKTEDGQRHPDYLWVTCTIVGQKVSITDIGCMHAERTNIIRAYIEQHMPKTFPSPHDAHRVNKETEHYLTIADEIAKEAHMCSAGDDYRPGFFSGIYLDDAGILLKQINHWNARSLDHKQDYHLRNLEFHIPNATTKTKRSFMDDSIGRMVIQFSDSSSSNNKTAGDRIFQKIQEQKLLFENEKK